MKRLGFLTLATGALAVLAVAGPAVAADAQPQNSRATQDFCTALLQFDTGWPQINLDHPGQPFFNDGNNDGIADLLQLAHARLPSLGSGLQALATTAPSNLKAGLRTMATDVQALAQERAPATAAQSSQEVKPVEQTASRVQRDLKASGCLGKVTAANAAADAAAEGTSGSSTQGKTQAVVLVFLLLNLPLIRRVWRHSRRPAVKRDGSGFKGNLRRWKVDTMTGTVVGVDRDSATSAFASGPVGPGGYVQVSSITTTTEAVRLRRADGSQRTVPLVNFSAYPARDDVVTICLGRKRSQEVAFALLNHTTHSQIVQPQNLYILREGGTARQIIFLFGLIFGSILSMFVAVFGGALWLVLVWLVLMVLFVLGSRREASMDTGPLWRRAVGEVELLPA